MTGNGYMMNQCPDRTTKTILDASHFLYTSLVSRLGLSNNYVVSDPSLICPPIVSDLLSATRHVHPCNVPVPVCAETGQGILEAPYSRALLIFKLAGPIKSDFHKIKNRIIR
jgi:hypothetical protein